EVLVWGITDPLKSTMKIERTEVKLSFPFKNATNEWAPQQGSSSAVSLPGVTYPRNAVFRDNLLYMVIDDANNWFATSPVVFNSVGIVARPVSNHPAIPTTAPTHVNWRFGKNASDDPPNSQVYYGWPGIEVNALGDMVVVYNRWSPNLYPEVRSTVFFH